jgi:uncharacterized protein (TIGR02145 family)
MFLLWPSVGFDDRMHGSALLFEGEHAGSYEYVPDSVGSNNWDYKNLNVDKFANGEAIPQAQSLEQWKKAGEEKKPAWCYYENDPSYGRVYGKLYNWYAVTDPRGMAPGGWHIPDDAEWTAMNERSTRAARDSTVNNKQTGFARLHGGYRLNSGVFSNMGRIGYWWSSSEHSADLAWYRYLHEGYGQVGRGGSLKDCGFSVRCIRD